MRKFKAAYNVFLWALSFVILVLVILFLAAAVTGHKLFCVQTGSMTPTYPIGTLLVIEPVEFESISAGDVVTFHAGEAIVTHRVETIDEAEGTLTTKGDANPSADSPTRFENVIGKVRFGIKYAGYPSIWLHTRFGKVMLFDVVLAVCIIKLCLGYFFGDEEETAEE